MTSFVKHAAVVAVGVVAFFACCAALAATVTCMRPSHVYSERESAEFDVTAEKAGTPVEVRFSRTYLPPFETFVTTTPVRVSCALGEPGFVVCTVREGLADGTFGKPVRAGAGFDPAKIRTVLPPPKDYDAFWKSAFAEQDAIPADFTSNPLSNGVELVSCRTVWGTRMYGFLHVPEGKGPFPMQVMVWGGSSIVPLDDAVAAGASPEYAKRGFLFIHLPAWEPLERTAAEANARQTAWMKSVGSDRDGLHYWNCEKGPRERWFYRCILGSCRLIDYVASRPGVDRARICYEGASTGGGYGVFLAAFSPHIRAAICEVPNYGNIAGPSVGRPCGEDDRGEHWQTSLYYDTAYCAPRITCPVFMSAGYVDNSCCPETVYSIYNALVCPKTMFDKTENGHGDVPKGYRKVRRDWLERTGMVDPAETWDVVVVGGTVRAVAAAVAAKKSGAKTLLVAPRLQLGDDASGRLRLDAYENGMTDALPHHLKLTRDGKDSPKVENVSHLPRATLTPSSDKLYLDTLLTSNTVPFRLGTAVTRASRHGASPYLLETWNRSGRGTLAARTVVDATGEPYLSESQGVRFAPFKPCKYRFCRYVLNGEKPSAPGLSVDEFQNCYWAVIPGWDVKAPKGFPNTIPAQLYRCTAAFDLKDDSPVTLAKTDAAFRDLTFGPLQVDAGDMCWPLDPLRPLLRDGAKDAAARGWFWCPKGSCTDETVHALTRHLAASERMEDTFSQMRQDAASTDEWPVLATADVAVAGGGTCGSPAAIAAARAGAKVVVCEFYFNLGGTQTTGLLAKYFHGNRVGFTPEIDAGVAKLGSIINQTKAEYYRREIEKAGGTILFGTRVVDAELGGTDADGRRIVTGLRVVTADGRKGVIRAKVTIDATGNADVAAAAGAPTVFGAGRPEAPILQGTSISWRDLAVSVSNYEVTFTDDTDAESIRRGLWQTRRDYGVYRWDLAPFIGSRERRHIVGDFVVRTCDMARGRTYRDTVTICKAGQDSHGVFSEDLLFFTTLSGGRQFLAPVPYRAFFPKGLSNLLVTGLGLSADRDALAVMRMQPDLQNEGYAAGRAAAMAARADVSPDRIDVRALQRHLVEKGIIPVETLTQEDTPPLSADALKALVPQVCAATNDNLNGIWEFFAAGGTGREVVAELARKPPFAAGTREAFHFALLAAAMEVKGCEAELVKGLRPVGTNVWDKGYSSAMCFGPRFSLKDEAIIALARTKYAPFGKDLAAMMRALPDDADFSHLRAIAIYLDAVPEKACVPELARILRAVGGHAQSFSDGEMPKFPKQKIHPQLKELMVARTLYRLGDKDGLAKSVLESYRDDPVKVFADFAKKTVESKAE